MVVVVVVMVANTLQIRAKVAQNVMLTISPKKCKCKFTQFLSLSGQNGQAKMQRQVQGLGKDNAISRQTNAA
jgi:hypothetical protein